MFDHSRERLGTHGLGVNAVVYALVVGLLDLDNGEPEAGCDLRSLPASLDAVTGLRAAG